MFLGSWSRDETISRHRRLFIVICPWLYIFTETNLNSSVLLLFWLLSWFCWASSCKLIFTAAGLVELSNNYLGLDVEATTWSWCWGHYLVLVLRLLLGLDVEAATTWFGREGLCHWDYCLAPITRAGFVTKTKTKIITIRFTRTRARIFKLKKNGNKMK